MAQVQIKVYTPALELTGIVEDYESATFTRSFYEAGAFSITINRNIENAALLVKGNYVQFGDDTRDSGKIVSVKSMIDENGRGSQKLIASGYDLRAMFTQRSVMQINDIDSFYLSAPAETVIKTLISSQCGSLCTDAKRRFPNLVIMPDLARGETYSITAKYTQVYTECATVATQSFLGWYVYIDHVNKTFVLDCEVGLDLSVNQSVNPYCLFSPDMDSLKSATFTDNVSYFRNLVYVGGDGEGHHRLIHTGYDTTEPEGFDRYEMFDDASNLATVAALTTEAQSVLAQYNQSYELEGDILVMSPYVYKEQYNVGDICTVRFNDVELDVRILEITQSWVWGEYIISSVLGKPLSLLSKQISELSNAAGNKSSTSESGTNVSGMKAGVLVFDISSADITMDGSECIYNIIELTGAMTADRTITFYLDGTRYYGRKAYRLIISATSAIVKRKITLTTGIGDDVEIWVGSSIVSTTHDVFVTGAGDVIESYAESQLPLKATNFPGICAQCPITDADISINYTTRVLTITPPLGYFHFFVDGGGIVTRYEKIGAVNFPAFTDTTGIWYFYFDATGTAVTTMTPWNNFDVVAAVYRILWNATKTGPDKSVVHAIETHLNTISGIDHAWKHKQGAIWFSGADCFNNVTASGTPNADGRNTVVSFNDGVFLDDNLEYTVVNSSGGGNFQQVLGNITPASLNATNSSLLPIRYETGAALVDTLPATRFPFAWNAASNRPEFITTTGVRTLVDNLNFFTYFVYVIQDPRNGQAIRSVSSPVQYTSLTNAQGASWATIQSSFTTLNDGEIRPMYRLIFEYKQTWNAGCKYSVLREVTDIRKQQIAQLSLSAGSLAASSVTFIPGTSGLAATNAQSALVELAYPTTAKISVVDADTVTGNDSADGGKVKKWTWTVIKAFLKTWFDSTIVTTAITNNSGVKTYTIKLTGTTAAVEGGAASAAHGLTVGKIVSATSIVWLNSVSGIVTGNTWDPGRQYDLFVSETAIYILNHATNSENILSKPFTIWITYEA